MKLNVEVISKEVIKPSSPTPHYLKTLKLSLLDQSTASVHVPIILFYSANNNNNNNKVQYAQEQTDHLKKSLSEILTHFYPLGGRISDNNSIDCNDEGINFFEAQVSGDLSHVLNHPLPDQLDQLLPKSEVFYVQGPKALLSIQVNIFDCGGMALAVCVWHKAGDAHSLSLFLKSWAFLTKGDNQTPKPKLDLTSLFPPKSDIPSFALPSEDPVQKFVTKRFVFDDTNLASLKAKCSNNLYVEHPTRVEAVCALIWRSAIGVGTDSKKSASMALVAMNMRRRMVPPLSDLAFGNCVTSMPTTSTPENSRDLHCLVAQLREAIRKVDSEFLKGFRSTDGFLAALASFYEAFGPYIKGEVELYIFSSWCRMSFYETNFGWGNPVWASFGNLATKNGILLMDTKCGKGIEAWVSLNEEDMSRFECDPDLLSFTSTN